MEKLIDTSSNADKGIGSGDNSECNKDNDDFIPGTLNIYAFEINKNHTSRQESDKINEGLNLSSSRTNNGLKTFQNIILIPQPTNSSNDPLNWNFIKKFWNFFLVVFIVGFTAATSNIAGSAQDSLNEKYGISYDAMNTGAGVLFVAIGSGTFLLAPCANLYGRKITYFICILFGLVGAVWFAVAKTTSDTIWSQLFVGVSESCAEAQAQLSISDLYFHHQLGSTLTVYILATSVGTYLGPIIAGYIVQYIGFRFIGWFVVFISGGLLIVILLLMHETYFDRTSYTGVINAVRSNNEYPTDDNKLNLDNLNIYNENQDKSEVNEKATKIDISNINDSTSNEINNSTSHEINDTGISDNPKSYWQSIKLITPSNNLVGTGFKQYITQLRLLLKVFMFPPVIFSGLVWGMQDVLLTFYLTVEDDQYYDPPYNYDDVKVSLMNVPCLIGAVIGCIYAGILSDWFTIWLAKRNNGIQEAEYRLWFLILPAIISPIGLILFAVGTDQVWNWRPTYVGLGFIGFGFGSAGDTSMAYLMDAYPEMVLEMMVGVAIVNNYLSCIFTFVCSIWLDKMSNTNTFIILAVIEFVIMLIGIPMTIYGKSIRKWTKNWYLEYCDFRDGI